MGCATSGNKLKSPPTMANGCIPCPVAAMARASASSTLHFRTTFNNASRLNLMIASGFLPGIFAWRFSWAFVSLREMMCTFAKATRSEPTPNVTCTSVAGCRLHDGHCGARHASRLPKEMMRLAPIYRHTGHYRHAGPAANKLERATTSMCTNPSWHYY